MHERTQQRTLTGGAGGAAGGAIIGAIAGNPGLGAAIGGATGLAGGFLYGQHEESKKQAYQQGMADGYQRAQQTGGSRYGMHLPRLRVKRGAGP